VGTGIASHFVKDEETEEALSAASEIYTTGATAGDVTKGIKK